MLRVFAWLVALGLLGYAGLTTYRYLLPCNQPVLYYAGIVDPKFAFSDSAFHQAMTAAAQAWNAAAGRELLREDPRGLPVSAIYDERQQAADSLKDLGIALDAGERSYQDVKARYDTLKAAYDRESAAYIRTTENFDRQKQDFEARLAQAEADGFTPDESAAFLAESQKINAAIPGIRAQEAALQAKREELNGVVTVLNTLAAQQNKTIEQYNGIEETVGHEYEAGVFTRENGVERIEVYAFEDMSDLQSLLTHEFGHALGVEHTDDPQSVMYRLQTGQNTRLTETDRQALAEACGW